MRLSRRMILLAPVFAWLLWLPLAPATLTQEATAEPAPPGEAASSLPEISIGIEEAQMILREAQNAQQRATDAIEFINLLLALLQGVGVIIAIIGGYVTFVGFRDGRKRAEDIRNELAESRKLQQEVNNALLETRTEQKEVRFAVLHAQGLEKQITEQLTALKTLREALDARIEAIEKPIKIQMENASDRVENKNRAIALTQLAQQQISINNLKAAAQTLERALEYDDDNNVILYFLGDVYVRLGEVDRSMGYLKQAMQGEEDYPDAEAVYAYALRLQGDRAGEAGDRLKQSRDYYDAKTIFLKLHQQYPELLDLSGESVYGALASIFRRIGERKEAIAWYERVRQITPLNSYPINNLALLHYLEGDTDKAKTYFQQSLENAQRSLAYAIGDYWRWFDLITAQVALAETPKAEIITSLKRVFELNPGEDPLSKLLDGLVELSAAPQAPPHITQIIHEVEAERDKLRGDISAG